MTAESTYIQIISWMTIAIAIPYVFVFMTGIGKRVWQRFKQRIMYKKGRHVNTIFVHNTGVAQEMFIKKDEDGSFQINNNKYIINRQMTILLDGIPTHRHIEGKAEPIPWDTDKLADYMSTAELEQVITNNMTDNLISALLAYKMIVTIAVITVVLLAVISIYFNYNIFDIVVQGGAGTNIGDVLKGR